MSAIRFSSMLPIRKATSLRLSARVRMPIPMSAVGINRLRAMPNGSRAFWSFDRFAKTLTRWTRKPDQALIVDADTDKDPRYSPDLEPLRIEVVPEPSELKDAATAWITCDDGLLSLRLFEKGDIVIQRDPSSRMWKVKWKPNTWSPSYEEHKAWMPAEGTITCSSSLKLALRKGDEWIEEHFPLQFQYLQTDTTWVSEPGTEKALDYLFNLQNKDKDEKPKLRPKELDVNGKRLAVKDLTKGHLYALIQVAKYNRKRGPGIIAAQDGQGEK